MFYPKNLMSNFCSRNSVEPPCAAQLTRTNSFVRRPILDDFTRTSVCSQCQGSHSVLCHECEGKGKLKRGGYNRRNPVQEARVVGSKWTAMERTFGWRHFQANQKRKQGKETFVLLVSTCDTTTQFWINIKNLKERERWAAGWLQREEVMKNTGVDCKVCNGTGLTHCPLCYLAGEVIDL